MRWSTVLLLLAALLVPGPALEATPSGIATTGTAPGGTASVEAVTPPRAGFAEAGVAEALGVLRDWDARRAEAWAQADVPALRSLYVAGSQAARADVRLLRAYTARGLVVRRLVTQVFAVRLLDRSSTSLRLTVFDRVAGGEMARSGSRLAVPSSAPVTRTVSFRLVDGGWRVSAVSGSGPGPRGGRR